MKNLLFIFIALLYMVGIKEVYSQQPVPPKTPTNNKVYNTCSRGMIIKGNHKHNDHEHHEDEHLTKRATAINCPNSMSAWSAYSGRALVRKLIEATDYDKCLRSLFKFDQNSGPKLYTDNNIYEVVKEIHNKSVSYNGTQQSGMLGLVTFLHTATYHEYYQPTKVKLSERTKTMYGYAIESMATNNSLWKMDEFSISVLDEFLVLCDYPSIRHRKPVIKILKKVLKNLVYNDTWKPIKDKSQLLNKYATAYNRAFFILFRGLQPIDKDFEKALNEDTEVIELLAKLVEDSEIKSNKSLNFFIGNAIGELTRMTGSDILSSIVEPYLAKIVKNLERLSPEWYQIISSINSGKNCSKYGLCKDMKALKKEVNKILFPNTFVFDDGKLIVKTPLNYETVLPLYYATKQAQAQFFRFLETDEPLADDVNTSLNMVVYGTRQEYLDWQTLLNNLSSNNGGMYIERNATFYTYERTTAESTLTLEELFRHEYVHYLQGRYMAHGYWGESDIYKNNRLVWFEEGMAELFAGSTSSNGVKIRESQGKAITRDGKDGYMTVKQVLSAIYDDGFKFYRYGNILWDYWFNNDYKTAKEIVKLVRANNVAGYDAKINELKNNTALQTAYTNYLNNVVIKPKNWWSVYTPWKKDKYYTIGNIAHIQQEFTNITGKQATVKLNASKSLRRFRIEGKLYNGNFNTQLNQLIEKLNNNKTINNFKYLVGYFKNVSGNTADYIITGPLRDPNVSDKVVADFNSSTTNSLTGSVINFNNNSTGYIKSYNWTFTGGSPNSSTEANPKITYNKKGKYTVKLTVKGNSNNAITEKKNYINIYTKPSITYCTPFTKSDYTFLAYVNFAGISNASNKFPKNGYSDFTDKLGTVEAGKTYDFKATPQILWKENNINAWVDWNQDGKFDTSERIVSKDGLKIESKVTIPTTAKSGITRMRVRYSYGKKIDACTEETYMGETEDYSLLVKSDVDPGDTPKDYCKASVTNSRLFITNVKFVTINKASTSFPKNGYADFTAIKTNVLIGKSYPLEIKTLDTWDSNYMNAWIDWNQNGKFESSEKILSTNGKVFAKQITIPSNAKIGSTRMRIRYSYSRHEEACGEAAYGEVEDYTIVIKNKDDGGGNPQDYCKASVTNSRLFITNVKFATINNASTSFPKNGYADFTAIKTNVLIGKSYPLEIKTLDTWDSNYMNAWIDWNQNGKFDTNEKILSTNGKVFVKQITIPSNAKLGSTRMRIRYSYSRHEEACGEAAYGEVEDYTIVIKNKDDGGNPQNYCKASVSSNHTYIKKVQFGEINNSTDGFPTNGYADFTSINTHIVKNQYYKLTVVPENSWDNNHVNVWIDWNQNGTFDTNENVFREKGKTLSKQINIPSNAKLGKTRMRVRYSYGKHEKACGNDNYIGEVEDYSVIIKDKDDDVETPNKEYCKASVSSNHTFIKNVQFGEINNSTDGFPTNGYADFTSINTHVVKNQYYKLTVTPQNSWDNNHINVWIDWNQNGTFDTNEKVLSRKGRNFSREINVPSNAKLGKTRMRVRYSYGKHEKACGNDNYIGEVEDYSVTVSNSNNLTSSIVDLKTITVYPNPASTLVTINYNGIKPSDVKIYLYDISNRLITTIKGEKLSVENLTRGTYILKIIGKGKTQSRKLIIN